MAQRIILVRHGRSAHVVRGCLDLTAFLRWREAYESAGVDERDAPPAALKHLAAASGIIVASPAPRAVHSAKLLDGGREIVTSPLLEELELAPLKLPLRMPLIGWALAVGARRPGRSPAELERAGEAAAWLIELAERHQSVLAVTHASFRSVLSAQLAQRGWRCETPRRRSHHWSAWTFHR